MQVTTSGRRVLVYFAWSRLGETHMPITTIDDRLPAIFELRRIYFPKYESLSNPQEFDQGIAGFLDHVQKPNFRAFIERAEHETGQDVVQVERVLDDGGFHALDTRLLDGIDTLVILSLDSLRTAQAASALEADAIREFLHDPDHVVFVCPHHDIGEAHDLDGDALLQRRVAEHVHHGDLSLPPQQGFGGLARTLLAALGLPVDNRFGLRPAVTSDGSPALVDVDRSLDELGVMAGVESLNSHPHLPHLERMGGASNRLDVLVRQHIDSSAPPHPALGDDFSAFNAVLQSSHDVFAGKLFVCDATLFSSTQGGLENLSRLWSNVLKRPQRKAPVAV